MPKDSFIWIILVLVILLIIILSWDLCSLSQLHIMWELDYNHKDKMKNKNKQEIANLLARERE